HYRKSEDNKSASRKYGLNSFDRLFICDNDHQHRDGANLLGPPLEGRKWVCRPQYRYSQERIEQQKTHVAAEHLSARYSPARNDKEGQKDQRRVKCAVERVPIEIRY